MTICIAAISEEDKVVAITDRMLTIAAPVMTAYEISDNNKAVELDKNTVALFAGDTTNANEILKIAKLEIAKQSPSTVREMADIVNGAYTTHWQNILTNYIFRKYTITLNEFMHNQGSFEAEMVKTVTNIITNFKLDVEIIVSGIDGTGKTKKAHIFTMDSAGTVITQDDIGYACIGSGSQHATFSLVESAINKRVGYAEVLFALIRAKKRAEFDPGVGKLCDMVTINASINRLSDENVNKILEFFENDKKKTEKINKETIVNIGKLI